METRCRVLVAGLCLVVWGVGFAGCGSEEAEAPAGIGLFAEDEMASPEATRARRTLERFLSHLENDRFVEAAALYQGQPRELRDLNQDVAPDDLPELLERLCRRHGGACLPARVVDGQRATEDRFVFEVEFLRPDGTPFETGDPVIPESRRTRFPMRVARSGAFWFVLDLPPRG